jgi:hypothetical protein
MGQMIVLVMRSVGKSSKTRERARKRGFAEVKKLDLSSVRDHVCSYFGVKAST